MEKIKIWLNSHKAEIEFAGMLIGVFLMAAILVFMFHLAAAIAPHRMYQI